MKINLDLVIKSLQHCSDEQEEELLQLLNDGFELSAGPVLSEIVLDHIESMDEDTGPTQQQLDEEAGFGRGE